MQNDDRRVAEHQLPTPYYVIVPIITVMIGNYNMLIVGGWKSLTNVLLIAWRYTWMYKNG